MDERGERTLGGVCRDTARERERLIEIGGEEEISGEDMKL
jgi:hypothetical protein